MSTEPVNLAEYAENLTIAYSEAYIGSNAEQETMHELTRLAPHLVSRIRELEATITRAHALADELLETGSLLVTSGKAGTRLIAALEGGDI